MREWSLTTTSAEQTRDLGRLIGRLLPSAAVLLLTGDLGAGKTCLTQGVAQGLDVPPDEPVTSPTFTLMNRYSGRVPLNHFDLYRLAGTDDLLDLGFEEYLSGDGVTVVEWADRASDLSVDALHLHLAHAGENSRQATFRVRGEMYEGLLERLKNAWLEKGVP